jgi:hypothetical protein
LRDPKFPTDLLLKLPSNERTSTIPEYVVETCKIAEKVWADVKSGIERAQKRNRAANDQKRGAMEKEFNIGENILIKEERPKHKFDGKWNGPWKVIGKDERENLILKEVSSAKLRLVHPEKCKKYTEVTLPMRAEDEPNRELDDEMEEEEQKRDEEEKEIKEFEKKEERRKWKAIESTDEEEEDDDERPFVCALYTKEGREFEEEEEETLDWMRKFEARGKRKGGLDMENWTVKLARKLLEDEQKVSFGDGGKPPNSDDARASGSSCGLASGSGYARAMGSRVAEGRVHASGHKTQKEDEMNAKKMMKKNNDKKMEEKKKQNEDGMKKTEERKREWKKKNLKMETHLDDGECPVPEPAAQASQSKAGPPIAIVRPNPTSRLNQSKTSSRSNQ